MEIKILIERLQIRILEFKSSESYLISPLTQDINSIQIALSLFEMTIYCNRKLKEEEMYWFNGGYYIANDITGEWEDISKMYDEMVQIVKREID